MKVFIGSARESVGAMDWLAACLEEFGHEPVRWDSPGLFPPGENAFEALIVHSKTIDAAIFIFGEDDKVWYRGDSAYQPRDNVLIEYGAFHSERIRRAGELFGWVRDGSLRVRVSQRYPLSEGARAHAFLESRQSIGKVLLVP